MACYKCNSPAGTETRLCPQCIENRLAQRAGHAVEGVHATTSVTQEFLAERKLQVRLVSLLLWFLVIFLASSLVIGGVVGGLAGREAGAVSFEEWYRLCLEASQRFFKSYGVLTLLGQIAVTGFLAIGGLLAGTTRYRLAGPISEPSSFVQVLCCWPILLAVFGGAIGGGLGGVAAGLSLSAYKWTQSGTAAFLISVLLGGTAVLTWYHIALYLQGG